MPETIVELANGHTLRSDSPHQQYQSGEYVRICDPDGKELCYWHFNEWRDDPVLVMGAILNFAANPALGTPLDSSTNPRKRGR